MAILVVTTPLFQQGGVQYDPAASAERSVRLPSRTPSENLQTLFPAERAAGLLDQVDLTKIDIGKGRGGFIPMSRPLYAGS